MGWGVLVVVAMTGALFELTLGQVFVCSFSDVYRDAIPWVLPVLLVLVALGVYQASRRTRAFESRTPTRWIRRLVVYPLSVLLGSAVLVMAPLGWSAALGWLTGAHVQGVPGEILSVRKRALEQRGCKLESVVRVQGASASLCLDGLHAGPLKQGDRVAIAGRRSIFGMYVEAVR